MSTGAGVLGVGGGSAARWAAWKNWRCTSALRNGLSEDEIGEVLLHSAIYCGVPATNAAFAVAQRVLAEPPAQ